MYAIDWQIKAYRQLQKIREALYDAVDTLRHWPDCRNVKASQP